MGMARREAPEPQTCLSAFRDRLMEDLYLRENAKSRPSFSMDQGPFKDRIREFFPDRGAGKKVASGL